MAAGNVWKDGAWVSITGGGGGVGATGPSGASGAPGATGASGPGGIAIVTSGTRPGGAATGSFIFETDTERTMRKISGGSGWMIIDEPWQTYTPVLYQGPLSSNITKSIVLARYKRRSASIIVQTHVIVAGNPAVDLGTAGQAVQLQIPFDLLNSALEGIVGIGVIYDASTTTRYICNCEGTQDNFVGFGPNQAAGALWGSAPSIGLRNNDQVRFSVEYRYDPASYSE